jgi:hypothetical protein
MSLEQELRDRVESFLKGNDSFRAFEDWFVDFSWDIEESHERGAIALAHQVQGLMAEASHAKWSDVGLREELANVLRPREVTH